MNELLTILEKYGVSGSVGQACLTEVLEEVKTQLVPQLPGIELTIDHHRIFTVGAKAEQAAVDSAIDALEKA